MANPHRGQVALQVGDVTYTMQLSPHALAMLKKEKGLGLKGIIDALQEMGDDPDFDLIVAILWASMQDHHPEMTIEDAAKLYPAGGLEEIIEKVQEVLTAAFPKQAAAAAAVAENPQKAATKK